MEKSPIAYLYSYRRLLFTFKNFASDSFSGRTDARPSRKRKYRSLVIVWLIALAAWIPDVVKSTTMLVVNLDSQIPVLHSSSLSLPPVLYVIGYIPFFFSFLLIRRFSFFSFWSLCFGSILRI